jgi:hypothetical protein
MPDPAMTWTIFLAVWAAVALRAAFKEGYDSALKDRGLKPKEDPAKLGVYKRRRRGVGSRKTA